VRIVRFGVTGVVATATHVGCFAVANELLRVPPVPANALAFLIAFLTGFTLNFAWTFRARGRVVRRMLQYFGVAVAGLGLNSALMYFAVYVAQWSPYAGIALSIALTPLLTYTLSRRFVFA
jgi:putative flippase GtrA